MAGAVGTKSGNAQVIIADLVSAGYSQNAIIAILCNGFSESVSTFNPYVVQGDLTAIASYNDGPDTLDTDSRWPITGAVTGGGIWQCTPITKDPTIFGIIQSFNGQPTTPDVLQNEMNAFLNMFQTGWIAGNIDGLPLTDSSAAGLTFEQFKTSNLSPQALTDCFIANYERGTYSNRYADNWPYLSQWGLSFTGVAGGQSQTKPAGQTADKNVLPCISAENPTKKPTPSSGSSSTPGQGALPNGTISCFDPLINTSVGNGQCYGFTAWWVLQCGGGCLGAGVCPVIQASQNPNIDQSQRPDSNPLGMSAEDISFDYPWGVAGTPFANFTAGIGTPPGGWKTGDIFNVTTTFPNGHTGVVEQVLPNGDFTFISQNMFSDGIVTRGGEPEYVGITWNMQLSGGFFADPTWVRPKSFPTCAGAVTSSPMRALSFSTAATSGMNFIDISNNNVGLNLDSLSPAPDGVILKASEGTYFTDPDFAMWAPIVLQKGWKLGAYHFLSGGDPVAEADYFSNIIGAYNGKLVWFADYEAAALNSGTGYLLSFMNEVKSRTGSAGGVYTSASVLLEQDFSQIAAAGYGVWFAQYASNDPTGWQADPWYSGNPTADFPANQVWGQQYTDNLQIGWPNGLDGSLMTISADAWNTQAGGGSTTINSKQPKGQEGVANDDPCLGMGLSFFLQGNPLFSKTINKGWRK